MEPIYSKKALLLIDGEFRTICSGSLAEQGIENGEGVFDSLDALRRAAEEGVLAPFIRAQLVSLVERKGPPLCFILAFPSRMGIPKEKDPDGTLVARSLFLACIAMGLDPKYSSIRFNILFIVKGEDQARVLDNTPSKLLGLLKLENDKLKDRIDLFSRDKAEFGRSFLLKFVDSGVMSAHPSLMMKGFLSQIDIRTKIENRQHASAPPAISTKNDAPAHVVYVVPGGKIFVDGAVVDGYNGAEALDEGRFHIIGALTTKNLKDVLTRVKQGVLSGIHDLKFTGESEIVITLGESCVIDATAATGLAQLLVSELARYKNKKIIASSVNDGILRRSHGYSMIREFVRVDRY